MTVMSEMKTNLVLHFSINRLEKIEISVQTSKKIPIYIYKWKKMQKQVNLNRHF